MNRKKYYKDMKKFVDTRNRQKTRYYGKTSRSENYYQKWTEKEITIIMKHECTDTEISKILGRSVASIQTMRSKIKNG